MDFVTLLWFAVGLCFDSFAVSLSCGMACRAVSRWRQFRFAAVLGFCQGAMPIVGWAAATRFRAEIEAYDHWVAFALLLFLGGKMVWEAIGDAADEELPAGDPFAWSRNMLLGIATSIDALVAGIAMALLTLTIVPAASQGLNMAVAAGVIAVVTILSSLTGLAVGRRSRGRIGERAEWIGGVILILIGLKVLVEHLMA